ncbi:hypothetical protein B0H10DRAFT_1959307 [Mycena sp. CBHHK59/15]|nr:hypothetical protein B0H10DRAFT_1959307 [Mycena sp. CBHHK59/15]
MPTLWGVAPEVDLQVGSQFGRRDSPKIGGSEGGFIGLVVGLAVIIFVSCVAIYILLRDHSPSERDRETRRQQSRYASDSPSAPLKNGAPWSAKLGGIAAKVKLGRGGHGWIQASGDAWEADEVERSREMSGLGAARGQPLDAPFHPPTDPYAASNSSETIRYDSDTQYNSMPSSQTNFATVPTSRSSSPIVRTSSPESAVQGEKDSPTHTQNRQFSMESQTSIRTFEGGTKFIEGL